MATAGYDVTGKSPPGGEPQQETTPSMAGNPQNDHHAPKDSPPGRTSRDHLSPTIINLQQSPDVDSKEQLKEAFRLLLEVLLTFVSFLYQKLHLVFSKTLDKALPIIKKSQRAFWVTLAFLVHRLCPDSRTQRRYLLVYAFGFLLGSFIYVSMLNVSYALKYESGRRVKPQAAGTRYISTTYPPFLMTGNNNLQSYKATTDIYGKWGFTTKAPKANIYQNLASDEGRLTHKDLAKVLLGTSVNVEVNREKPVIPKIIHQSWHIRLIPKEFSKWMLSWHKKHPAWRHLFWTGTGGNHLVNKVFPEYKPLYNNYTTDLHRFKVNRFFILYHYGGVFTDMDMESLQPLDSLLDKFSCVLTEQPLVHQAVLYNFTAPNYVVNSFMACSPKHPFLKFVLDMLEVYQAYDSNIEREIEQIEKSVGSLFLGDVLELYKIAFNRTIGESVHVLSSDWFMPNWNDKYLHNIATKCLSGVVLNPTAKDLCHRLTKTDFGNGINSYAFTMCHWIDMYDEDTRLKIAEGPVIDANELKL